MAGSDAGERVSETDRVIGGALGRGSGLLGLRLLQYVLLFGSSALVARNLGPAGRTAYILPLNVAGIASLVTNMSLETAAGRLLGRREAGVHALVGTTVGLAVLCALVGCGGAAAAGLALQHQLAPTSTQGDVLIASAIVFPTGISLVSGGLLLRIGALRSYGAVSALAALGQLCAVAVLYASHHVTVSNALLVNLLGFSAGAVGLTAALGYHAGPKAILPRVSPSVARHLLGAAVRVHPGVVTANMNLRLDLVVVSALSSRHATGLYSLAMTLAEAAMLASLTVSQSALHVQIREPSREAARYTLEFARQTFLVACLATAIASVLMYPFINLAYGKAWLGTVVPVIVTLLAVTVVSMEGPIRFMLIQVGNPLWTSVAAAVALLANLVFDLLLIPAIGIVGASLATLISYSILTAFMLRWFRAVTGVRARGIFAAPHRGDPMVDLLLRRVGRSNGDASYRGPRGSS